MRTTWSADGLHLVVQPFHRRHALVVFRDEAGGGRRVVLTIVSANGGVIRQHEHPIREDVREAIASVWEELEPAGFAVAGHPAPNSVFLPCMRCGAQPYDRCHHADGRAMGKAHADRWL